MSHDQLIRHAVDAARAGNPALARIHLQKVAETAPDDPTVWLWLSWLADSPVSMIQCLKLVRRHEDYREIADSGLAFAQGLARFECNAVRIDSTPASDETACEISAREERQSVTVKSEAVFETQATFEFEGPSEDAEPGESTAEATEEATWETHECSFDEAGLFDEVESDDEDFDEDGDAEIRDALIAELEAVAAEALGSADDELSPLETEEELPTEPQTYWDGIDLLARTADAVADELKADSILDGDEDTLSFPEYEFDLLADSEWLGKTIEATATDADIDGEELIGEEEIREADAEQPSPGEGSWFDYWLPKEQRPTSSPEKSDTTVSAEAAVPDEPVTIAEDVLEPESELASHLPAAVEAAPQDELAENVPHETTIPVNDPTDLVLELVYEAPLDIEVLAADEPRDEEFFVVADEAETPAMRPTLAPPPLPTEPETPKPVPVREPASAWRAARTDWFSADSSASTSLVPHNETATPPPLPPFAKAAATNPAATNPGGLISAPAQGTGPGERVPSGLTAPRPANRSMFDAEPTPPARIDPAGRGSITGSGPVPTGVEIRTQSSATSEIPTGSEKGSAEASGNSSGRPRQKLESSSRRTVLVVDGSPTVRKLVEMSLTRNGFRVVHAFDGVAAIKEIARQNPSLILMDANMPRLDGYQLCKLVKKHETTRHIPVVMLTGKEGVFDKLRGKLVGCSGYIAKPFSPEELVSAVGRFLTQPAAL